MPYPQEHIVDTISTGETDRTLVINCTDRQGRVHTEIRQQSYGGSRVGWFTQSSVQVDPNSLAALRVALGVASAMPEVVSAKNNSAADRFEDGAVISGRISRPAPPALRVWQAESA